MRLPGLPALAALGLVFLILLGPGPVLAGQGQTSPPPEQYLRSVILAITDLNERPVPGATAAIDLEWGRLLTEGDLVSNAEGLIRFQVEPVIEDLNKGRGIRDRFLLYRTVYTYQVTKPGCLPVKGKTQDDQEFASFEDPLYQDLNRRPSDYPLIVPIRLLAYKDFLKNPADAKKLKDYIQALDDRAENFSLAPRSLQISPQGVLTTGLIFDLLFDPAQMGLLDAAEILLVGPVKICLETIDNLPSLKERTHAFEFKVLARFQYRTEPFAMPEERTLTYRLSAEAAERVRNWTDGQTLPVDGVLVTVDGQTFSLDKK